MIPDIHTQKNLEKLLPYVAVKAYNVVWRMKELGYDVRITSSYRTHAQQEALYAQGRTKGGNIVTNARGGQSWHNYKVAFDSVLIRDGQAIWNDETFWKKLGEVGKKEGFEWGGDWITLPDRPHLQMTFGFDIWDLYRMGEKEALKKLTEKHNVAYIPVAFWALSSAQKARDLGLWKDQTNPQEIIASEKAGHLLKNFGVLTKVNHQGVQAQELVHALMRFTRK